MLFVYIVSDAKYLVERINENIIHKLFCRVSSGNNEVML